MDCYDAIKDLPPLHEFLLIGINDEWDNTLHFVSQDLGDDFVEEIAKADRLEFTEGVGPCFFWDKGNESRVDILREMFGLLKLLDNRHHFSYNMLEALIEATQESIGLGALDSSTDEGSNPEALQLLEGEV